jgi:hypothetical protein
LRQCPNSRIVNLASSSALSSMPFIGASSGNAGHKKLQIWL